MAEIDFHVKSASTIVIDGRPPEIALTLRWGNELAGGNQTFGLSPQVAFAIADALARHALRLDPGIERILRQRIS
jgi:hypothetical protein